MILLLWIPIICAIVIPIIVIRRSNLSWDDKFNAEVVMVIGGVVATIFLLICILVPIFNGAQLARLTTFHEINNSNYGIAIDETVSYLSQEDFEEQLIVGSLEKVALTGFISERIAEWRDGVNAYNLELAEYRYYATHPFLAVLYPSVPDHIKTLVIK